MTMVIDGTNGCTFPDSTIQTTTGKKIGRAHV